MCHVSPRSARERRTHYLVHQLDSKTKLSKHTTSTSYRCLALVLGNLSQRTPRFPKKTTISTTKKHAVDHQNPREHNLRHGPFLIIHQDSRSSHKKQLREPQKEASDLASELDGITYDWSRSPTGDEYGLLAKIIGEDEYNDLTNLTWVQEVEPTTYDPNITDTTPTHTRKRMEQEWERTRETWAIRKGFLRGVAANFREALDENWYS